MSSTTYARFNVSPTKPPLVEPDSSEPDSTTFGSINGAFDVESCNEDPGPFFIKTAQPTVTFSPDCQVSTIPPNSTTKLNNAPDDAGPLLMKVADLEKDESNNTVTSLHEFVKLHPTSASNSSSSRIFNRLNRHHHHEKKKIRNRLMQKNGNCNIELVNVPEQSRKFMNDLFNTLTELRWRYCILMFCLSFLVSWFVFAFIYYLAALVHGDFLNHVDEDWAYCVTNGDSFFTLFMFSVETQSTIGYGFRYPTDRCALVIICVMLQQWLGTIIQAMSAGVVFSKLARPLKRANTILFSKNAVICKRNGQLCLLLRLGDMRASTLAEAHVRLQLLIPAVGCYIPIFQMVKMRTTEEGEVMPFHQFDMSLGFETGRDRVFVIWPITVCHIIDESSPLYDISKDDLESGRASFEIIAILEGCIGSGSTTQAKTSYLPNEILWGHRFESLVTYLCKNGDYQIDWGLFHATVACQCPSESAKQLDIMQRAQEHQRQQEQQQQQQQQHLATLTEHLLRTSPLPPIASGSLERELALAVPVDLTGQFLNVAHLDQGGRHNVLRQLSRQLSVDMGLKSIVTNLWKRRIASVDKIADGC